MKAITRLSLIFSCLACTYTAQSAPTYGIEPQGISCAALEQDSAYHSKYLKANYKLVEGDNGWIFVTMKDLTEDFGYKGKHDSHLKKFVDVLDSIGVQVILLFTPTRGIMHPDQVRQWGPGYDTAVEKYYQAQNYYDSIGLEVVDWRALEQKEGEDFFFKRDIHWTPYGARATAKLVAERLDELGYADRSSESKFATLYSGVTGVKGTQRAVELICGTKLAEQSVLTYETAKTFDDSDGGSLFGDVDTPNIALVGTSFSANTKYNFKGFIEQYANTDILNFAVAGGGKTGAWIDLLSSDYFQETPPEIVVWEIPGYHNIIGSEELLGLIPLVHNGCADQSTFLQSNVDAFQQGGVRKEVLFSPGDTNVPSKNLVVDITLSDKTANALEATVWFGSGAHKTYRIKRNNRAKHDGRFVFEIGSGHQYSSEEFIGLDIDEIMNTDGEALAKEDASKMSASVTMCESPFLKDDRMLARHAE